MCCAGGRKAGSHPCQGPGSLAALLTRPSPQCQDGTPAPLPPPRSRPRVPGGTWCAMPMRRAVPAQRPALGVGRAGASPAPANIPMYCPPRASPLSRPPARLSPHRGLAALPTLAEKHGDTHQPHRVPQHRHTHTDPSVPSPDPLTPGSGGAEGAPGSPGGAGSLHAPGETPQRGEPLGRGVPAPRV